MVDKFSAANLNVTQIDNRTVDTNGLGKQLLSGNPIVNDSDFDKNLLKSSYEITTLHATADSTDILFLENAGRSFKDAGLQFTNFDYDYPADFRVEAGFNLISENIKAALIGDLSTLQSDYDNFSTRFLPILKLHSDTLNLTVNDDNQHFYIESRVHKSNTGNRGSFRVFLRWYPVDSVFNGEKVEKDTLVVLFYDPYHLVFPTNDGVGQSYQSLSGNNYSKHLKDKYYHLIPSELRRTVSAL